MSINCVSYSFVKTVSLYTFYELAMVKYGLIIRRGFSWVRQSLACSSFVWMTTTLTLTLKLCLKNKDHLPASRDMFLWKACNDETSDDSSRWECWDSFTVLIVVLRLSETQTHQRYNCVHMFSSTEWYHIVYTQY